MHKINSLEAWRSPTIRLIRLDLKKPAACVFCFLENGFCVIRANAIDATSAPTVILKLTRRTRDVRLPRVPPPVARVDAEPRHISRIVRRAPRGVAPPPALEARALHDHVVRPVLVHDGEGKRLLLAVVEDLR